MVWGGGTKGLAIFQLNTSFSLVPIFWEQLNKPAVILIEPCTWWNSIYRTTVLMFSIIEFELLHCYKW